MRVATRLREALLNDLTAGGSVVPTHNAAITRRAHCLLAPRQMGKSLSFLGETAAEGYPIVLS